MKFFYYLLESEESRSLYDALRSGISALTPSVLLPKTALCEVNRTLKAILTDNPQFFWFTGKWGMRQNADTMEIFPKYLFDHTGMVNALGGIEQTVRELREPILRFREPYQRLRFAYEWMLDNVAYGQTEHGGQTIYDALVKRRAVCKGMSKAFQFLMDTFGVFSTLQEGTLDGIAKHVWNVVEIEGKYYHVDISMGYDRFSFLFDDAKDDRYRCFAVSDAQLWRTHKLLHPEQPRLRCETTYQEGKK